MKTCREVMEQIAYKDDLNLVDHLMLRVHLFMCKKCNKTSKSIDNLDLSLQKLRPIKVEEEQIDQIKENVKKHLAS